MSDRRQHFLHLNTVGGSTANHEYDVKKWLFTFFVPLILWKGSEIVNDRMGVAGRKRKISTSEELLEELMEWRRESHQLGSRQYADIL